DRHVVLRHHFLLVDLVGQHAHVDLGDGLDAEGDDPEQTGPARSGIAPEPEHQRALILLRDAEAADGGEAQHENDDNQNGHGYLLALSRARGAGARIMTRAPGASYAVYAGAAMRSLRPVPNPADMRAIGCLIFIRNALPSGSGTLTNRLNRDMFSFCSFTGIR